MSVTMKDIAKRMNISVVTVHKALAGKSGVSEARRLEIYKIAEEMGYCYASGSRLSTKRTHNICVLSAEHFFDENSFYAFLYSKLVKALSNHQYYAILDMIPPEDELRLHMPKSLEDVRVDGVIVLGVMARNYLDAVIDTKLPVVFLDFYTSHTGVDSIVTDNLAGGCLMTEHLIAAGHRQIGYIGDVLATTSIMDRFLGYHKALLQNGIALEPEWILRDRDERQNVGNIVFPARMPTAFFCNCDKVAYEASKQLMAMGYRIPENISLVGFDDFVFANFALPPLTTYAVDTTAMVNAATDTIIRKIENSTYSIGQKNIPGMLVPRNSVTAPRSG